MSDKLVRVHRNISNRARLRDATDQKVVFKSALDNPFQVAWPKVSLNVQNMFLARAISLFNGISDFRRVQRQQRQKTKKRLRQPEDPSFATNNPPATDADAAADQPMPADVAENRQDIVVTHPLPSVHQFLTIGINAVTKKLESLSNHYRKTMVVDDADSPMIPLSEHPQLVLACQGDIDPPILVSHLPSLVAACNAARLRSDAAHAPKSTSWLVPLPRGSDMILAKTLGLKRVSVVSVDSAIPEFSEFSQLLETLPMLTASWLIPFSKPLIPTHIKQIRTTAPKNIRAAKEKRSQDRMAARQRRAASSPASRNKRRKQRIGLNEEGGSTDPAGAASRKGEHALVS